MKRTLLVLTRACPPKVFQDILPPRAWLTSRPLVIRSLFLLSCIWTSLWRSLLRSWRRLVLVLSRRCPLPPPSLSLVRSGQDCRDRTLSGGRERAPRAVLPAARGRAPLAVRAPQHRATHLPPGLSWVTPLPEVENTCHHVPVLSLPPPHFLSSTRSMRRVKRVELALVRTKRGDNKVISVLLVEPLSLGDWNREEGFIR